MQGDIALRLAEAVGAHWNVPIFVPLLPLLQAALAAGSFPETGDSLSH